MTTTVNGALTPEAADRERKIQQAMDREGLSRPDAELLVDELWAGVFDVEGFKKGVGDILTDPTNLLGVGPMRTITALPKLLQETPKLVQAAPKLVTAGNQLPQLLKVLSGLVPRSGTKIGGLPLWSFQAASQQALQPQIKTLPGPLATQTTALTPSQQALQASGQRIRHPRPELRTVEGGRPSLELQGQGLTQPRLTPSEAKLLELIKQPAVSRTAGPLTAARPDASLAARTPTSLAKVSKPTAALPGVAALQDEPVPQFTLGQDFQITGTEHDPQLTREDRETLDGADATDESTSEVSHDPAVEGKVVATETGDQVPTVAGGPDRSEQGIGDLLLGGLKQIGPETGLKLLEVLGGIGGDVFAARSADKAQSRAASSQAMANLINVLRPGAGARGTPAMPKTGLLETLSRGIGKTATGLLEARESAREREEERLLAERATEEYEGTSPTTQLAQLGGAVLELGWSLDPDVSFDQMINSPENKRLSELYDGLAPLQQEFIRGKFFEGKNQDEKLLREKRGRSATSQVRVQDVKIGLEDLKQLRGLYANRGVFGAEEGSLGYLFFQALGVGFDEHEHPKSAAFMRRLFPAGAQLNAVIKSERLKLASILNSGRPSDKDLEMASAMIPSLTDSDELVQLKLDYIEKAYNSRLYVLEKYGPPTSWNEDNSAVDPAIAALGESVTSRIRREYNEAVQKLYDAQGEDNKSTNTEGAGATVLEGAGVIVSDDASEMMGIK